jgi:hypothetical protein
MCGITDIIAAPFKAAGTVVNAVVGGLVGGLLGSGGNSNVQQTSLTPAPAPTSTTPSGTNEVNKELNNPVKRGRTSTLMTGPLGVVDNSPIDLKTLMARATRTTLG